MNNNKSNQNKLSQSAKAQMFNRKASDPKSQPDRILTALSIRSGQNVADIGAGGGYFVLRFADVVGSEGLVYAVDVNLQFLEIIRSYARERGLANIVALEADEMDKIKEGSLDLIFMRNVYHHLENRVEFFSGLKKYLKPTGRLAVIEHKAKGSIFSFRRLFGHHTKKNTINNELASAGFILRDDNDFLKEQNFLVFSPRA